MRILVTGFEPFGEHAENSSAHVVERLPEVEGATVVTELLPVSFSTTWAALRERIDEVKPDALLLVGQAQGRARIEVERVAINVADADIPDNDGAHPADLPVVEGGPVGLLATIDVRAAVEAIRAAGVPAGISNSAGTYVCNAVLYRALLDLDGIPVGFVHLPLLPGQALDGDRPSLSADQMVRGVAAVLASIVGRQRAT